MIYHTLNVSFYSKGVNCLTNSDDDRFWSWGRPKDSSNVRFFKCNKPCTFYLSTV